MGGHAAPVMGVVAGVGVVVGVVVDKVMDVVMDAEIVTSATVVGMTPPNTLARDTAATGIAVTEVVIIITNLAVDEEEVEGAEEEELV